MQLIKPLCLAIAMAPMLFGVTTAVAQPASTGTEVPLDELLSRTFARNQEVEKPSNALDPNDPAAVLAAIESFSRAVAEHAAVFDSLSKRVAETVAGCRVFLTASPVNDTDIDAVSRAFKARCEVEARDIVEQLEAIAQRQAELDAMVNRAERVAESARHALDLLTRLAATRKLLDQEGDKAAKLAPLREQMRSLGIGATSAATLRGAQ